MGWVICSDAVMESCDAVLIFVVTASRCICDAVSSHRREILNQCWCRYVNRLYQPRRNDHAVDYDDRYRNDPIRSLGLKIEISEFTGKVHPDNFIDWLSTVERVFDVRDIPDKLKVKLVAIKFRQHASLWWDHLNKRRRIKGKSKDETWEKMKKLMKAKFLPETHRQ
ncbi:reverse transcriptase domain-containing protein [Tanacetum coccineum]